MAENVTTPMAASAERPFAELRQVTVKEDEGIAEVNRLLSDGWRLMNIGFLSNATVYVLGKRDDKRRGRAGFVADD